MTRKIIHIFRRDIRLNDNTSLIEASKNDFEVLPIFIFDPAQIREHPFFSAPGFSFLCNSLTELDETLRTHRSRLWVFNGEPSVVIQSLLRDSAFQGVSFNRDYTPFSLKRDSKIFDVCKNLNKECLIYDDALLTAPEAGLKDDGTPYTVFTPYYKKNSKKSPAKVSLLLPKFTSQQVSFTTEQNLKSFLPDIESSRFVVSGGRKEALKIFQRIKDLPDYKETRNFPALDTTTKLSAHNKFGTISPRELYWEIEKYHGQDATIISELYWRGFFTQIGFFFPHVFSGAFNKKYDKLCWSENLEHLERWQKGETGFPIVDAGMRELNLTGFMHNRVRMIVASFLVKDLHISWREGEQYFARKLLDYDPAVNNGNWQWAASTGCDAQPYFRIFNPWLQQKRFDPNAEYIKKWIPELSMLSAKSIHQLETFRDSSIPYPSAIVDHSTESALSKAMYSEV